MHNIRKPHSEWPHKLNFWRFILIKGKPLWVPWNKVWEHVLCALKCTTAVCMSLLNIWTNSYTDAHLFFKIQSNMVLQANCESQSETCFKLPTCGCLANTIKKERSGEGNNYYKIVVCSQSMSNQEMKKQKHAKSTWVYLQADHQSRVANVKETLIPGC